MHVIDMKGAQTTGEIVEAYANAIAELTTALQIVTRYGLECGEHIATTLGHLAAMQAEQLTAARDATGNRLHRM